MSIKNKAIIILGASGDLAKRKLVPALLKLYAKKELELSCAIIGSGRTDFSDRQFREHLEVGKEFSGRLFYFQGIKGLRSRVDGLGGFSEIVVFMALPPRVYAQTARELAEEGFGNETTLIIEKPFGSDYDSAAELNRELHKYFSEKQIFRIDHYLAKEAVQNILVFRYANPVFYPIWNSSYIESIQINALEDIGIVNRGQYFDNAGIIRDMAQNHLIQLLALLTMEAPVSLSAEDIRTQKINLLKTIEFNEVRKFQYKGYLEEKGVAPGSLTETFAELKLSINNFRWNGVPIYIRTGKAARRKGTEIGVRLKKLPRLLFNKDGMIESNTIIFKIQPAEGIILNLSSKVPGGKDISIGPSEMSFCLRENFEGEIPEAYQKLLLDALNGDKTLFVSAEETELAWKKIAPLLVSGKPELYEKGSVPSGLTEVEWIDFDRYATACY